MLKSIYPATKCIFDNAMKRSDLLYNYIYCAVNDLHLFKDLNIGIKWYFLKKSDKIVNGLNC